MFTNVTELAHKFQVESMSPMLGQSTASVLGALNCETLWFQVS